MIIPSAKIYVAVSAKYLAADVLEHWQRRHVPLAWTTVIRDYKGPFKVGVASDVKKRLTQIQTGNAEPLTLAWCSREIPKDLALKAELFLHEILDPHCVSGEWFYAQPETFWRPVLLIGELLEVHSL